MEGVVAFRTSFVPIIFAICSRRGVAVLAATHVRSAALVVLQVEASTTRRADSLPVLGAVRPGSRIAVGTGAHIRCTRLVVF